MILTQNDFDYAPESSVLSYDFPIQEPFSSFLIWSQKKPALTCVPRLAFLVAPLDRIVESFIDRNALWSALYVGELARQKMVKNHISTTLAFAVDTDSENPERQDLVLIFSISRKPYSEILKIWNGVSREIHQELPGIVSERVSVRLVKA